MTPIMNRARKVYMSVSLVLFNFKRVWVTTASVSVVVALCFWTACPATRAGPICLPNSRMYGLLSVARSYFLHLCNGWVVDGVEHIPGDVD
jgi:hypothetical protein